jgi:hypothetical protein
VVRHQFRFAEPDVYIGAYNRLRIRRGEPVETIRNRADLDPIDLGIDLIGAERFDKRNGCNSALDEVSS